MIFSRNVLGRSTSACGDGSQERKWGKLMYRSILLNHEPVSLMYGSCYLLQSCILLMALPLLVCVSHKTTGNYLRSSEKYISLAVCQKLFNCAQIFFPRTEDSQLKRCSIPSQKLHYFFSAIQATSSSSYVAMAFSLTISFFAHRFKQNTFSSSSLCQSSLFVQPFLSQCLNRIQ